MLLLSFYRNSWMNNYYVYHCVQIWQKRREKLLKLKLCIFVLSRVHLECTNMILVKSDPTKVIKAKLKAMCLPKSRLYTIIFVFYAAYESVCIELQSVWDSSWLKVLKAKRPLETFKIKNLRRSKVMHKMQLFKS